MATLKLVDFGLSVWFLFRFFLAAVVANWSALSLPLIPLCPGHHRRVILMEGARLWISPMIRVASIL